MINIIKLIIFGHIHRWKILKQEPYRLHNGNINKVIETGTHYTLQCDKCGNIKTFRA